MPLIRKLEFAVELRMARLYDMTMRKIGPNAVEEIHRYLRDNGDRLQDLHWTLRGARCVIATMWKLWYNLVS
ncbi:hypothetical protein Q1695_012230 [Nippostrongylus brasiliensis]|nr:hypothetical protein Q1695_012230 [Nippostrongylus brasiliensis]